MIISKFLKRKRVIYDSITNEPYLERYYLLFENRPKWFPFNIVLHKFLRSDDPNCGLHDHPWPWMTIVLSGGYWETTLKGTFWRGPGFIQACSAKKLHRISIENKKSKKSTWTLFIMGKRSKEWGFLNNDKDVSSWEHYQSYLEKKEMKNANYI